MSYLGDKTCLLRLPVAQTGSEIVTCRFTYRCGMWPWISLVPIIPEKGSFFIRKWSVHFSPLSQWKVTKFTEYDEREVRPSGDVHVSKLAPGSTWCLDSTAQFPIHALSLTCVFSVNKPRSWKHREYGDSLFYLVFLTPGKSIVCWSLFW